MLLALVSLSRAAEPVGASEPELAQTVDDPVLEDILLEDAVVPDAAAQESVTADTPSREAPTPPSKQRPSVSVDGAAIETANKNLTGEHVFKDWRYRLNLSLAASAMYDDNIFIQRENEQEDFIFNIAPTIELAVGDYRDKAGSYLALGYTATQRLFLEHDSEDRLNHEVYTEFQLVLGKTEVCLKLGYDSVDATDIDVGNRAERDTFTGLLTARYNLTPKTTFGLDLETRLVDYAGFLDSQEYTATGWIDYMITPSLKLGPGVTFGVLTQEGGSEQTFEQISLRGVYTASQKLLFRASLGVETRQLDDEERVNPVGRVGASYQVFDGTELTLDVSRRVYASAVEVGRNFALTGITAGVRQRFLLEVFLTLTGGYSNADYQRASFEGDSSREDNFFFLRPGVAYSLRDWLDISIFYQFRSNDSTRKTASFENNQFGLQLNARF